MTTLTFSSNDALTMLRRNLLHARRYPAMVFSIVVMPILLLLVFNYFFGGALGTGVGGRYIDYLAPRMLLMIPAWMVASTAVGVATDLTKGGVVRVRIEDDKPVFDITGPDAPRLSKSKPPLLTAD